MGLSEVEPTAVEAQHDLLVPEAANVGLLRYSARATVDGDAGDVADQVFESAGLAVGEVLTVEHGGRNRRVEHCAVVAKRRAKRHGVERETKVRIGGLGVGRAAETGDGGGQK